MYKHMTYEQRKELKRLLDTGCSKSAIAENLGVHLATVYREIRRGEVDGVYDPEYSENTYQEMLNERGSNSVIDWSNELRLFISTLILDEKLSLAEVVERLRECNNFKSYPTSRNTLYTAIDNGMIPGVTRENLRSDTTVVFSNGLIHIAKWIKEELDIQDGDELRVEVQADKIIYSKTGININSR